MFDLDLSSDFCLDHLRVRLRLKFPQVFQPPLRASTIASANEFRSADLLACGILRPADRPMLNDKGHFPRVVGLWVICRPVNSTYRGRPANSPLSSNGDSQLGWTFAADI